MTSTIPIPGGPLNRELIDLAYNALGLSDSMFGRTDEEYASAMAQLRAMMAEYPFDQLGFDTNEARVQNESGIADKWRTAVAYALAARIAGTIGKTLSPQSQGIANRSFSALCAGVATISPALRAPGTVRGAGHRMNRITTYFAEGE